MLSNPSLAEGETYTVTYGDGESKSVTVSDIVTTIGSAGNTGGMGGRRDSMQPGGGEGSPSGGRP